MINKKAQVEKAITFPVFIIIVLIMAGFVFLSSVISLSAPNLEASVITAPADNLLLQTIEIEMNNEKKELLVYDFIYLTLKKDIGEEVDKELLFLLNEQKDCLFFYTEITQWKAYVYKDGEPVGVPLDYEFLYVHTVPAEFMINDKKIKIRYYFGSCPRGLNE